MHLHIYADRENKRPKSLNTSRAQLFMTCLGVVFLHVLNLAREDNSKNTNKHFLGAPLITEDDSCSFFVYLAAMCCIHFDFSDCLLLAKLLIIKCGETLSDLG